MFRYPSLESPRIASMQLRYLTTQDSPEPTGPSIKDQFKNVLSLLVPMPRYSNGKLWLAASLAINNNLGRTLALGLVWLFQFLFQWFKWAFLIFWPILIIGVYYNRGISNLNSGMDLMLKATTVLGFVLSMTAIIVPGKIQRKYASAIDLFDFESWPIVTFWEYKNDEFIAHNFVVDRSKFATSEDFIFGVDTTNLPEQERDFVNAWRDQTISYNRNADSDWWRMYAQNHISIVPRQAKGVY